MRLAWSFMTIMMLLLRGRITVGTFVNCPSLFSVNPLLMIVGIFCSAFPPSLQAGDISFAFDQDLMYGHQLLETILGPDRIGVIGHAPFGYDARFILERADELKDVIPDIIRMMGCGDSICFSGCFGARSFDGNPSVIADFSRATGLPVYGNTYSISRLQHIPDTTSSVNPWVKLPDSSIHIALSEVAGLDADGRYIMRPAQLSDPEVFRVADPHGSGRAIYNPFEVFPNATEVHLSHADGRTIWVQNLDSANPLERFMGSASDISAAMRGLPSGYRFESSPPSGAFRKGLVDPELGVSAPSQRPIVAARNIHGPRGRLGINAVRINNLRNIASLRRIAAVNPVGFISDGVLSIAIHNPDSVSSKAVGFVLSPIAKAENIVNHSYMSNFTFQPPNLPNPNGGPVMYAAPKWYHQGFWRWPGMAQERISDWYFNDLFG